jgi:hypothetical protein
VGKWISLLVVSIASLFGTIRINDEGIKIENANNNKNLNVINTLVEYETKKKYTNRLPYNTTKITVKGENGVVYLNENGKVMQTIKEVITEVIEIGTGPQGKYSGRLTGYGPDCRGCNSEGYVACFTKERQKHSLINDGIYYDDEEYGKVRILAAETKKFPCGTVIEVRNGNSEPFIGVVLDTGYAMRSAWKNEEILIDLAFSTEKDPEIRKITSRSVAYNVKRWGW